MIINPIVCQNRLQATRRGISTKSLKIANLNLPHSGGAWACQSLALLHHRL